MKKGGLAFTALALATGLTLATLRGAPAAPPLVDPIGSPSGAEGGYATAGGRAHLEERIRARAQKQAGARGQSEPEHFPFYPQAGQLWQDLFVHNFVDLDATGGILDWDCSAYTYDGHRGHDTEIRSFQEQRIGVPVFAALDGTVVDVHDGEFDENTERGSRPDNHVFLRHSASHHTWYGHLKSGSVHVQVGDTVAAGEQIGLTASSGDSSWPHLHFGSRIDGNYVEPSAGACGGGYPPGTSNWVNQVPIRRDLYLRAFTFSPNDFTGRNGLPWDEAIRTSAYPLGSNRNIYFRYELGNIPPNTRTRTTFFRPDGSIPPGYPVTGSLGNNDTFCRKCWWWSRRVVTLDTAGSWRLLFELNDQPSIDVRFDVNAAGSEANDPPIQVTLGFEPSQPTSEDAIFCNVEGPLAVRDPDFDLVRYHYRWLVSRRTVHVTTVRELDSAALSDAIPKGTAPAGSLVICEVTPSDGTINGPTVRKSVKIGMGHS